MPNENATRRGRKSPPPGETGQEAAYLRFLSDKQVPVTVKLRDGESVSGWIEYFDERMIRLTREGRPNLFIYKEQIRTITEQGKRPRNESRPAATPTVAHAAGAEPRRD
jgi:host factor-I protein